MYNHLTLVEHIYRSIRPLFDLFGDCTIHSSGSRKKTKLFSSVEQQQQQQQRTSLSSISPSLFID